MACRVRVVLECTIIAAVLIIGLAAAFPAPRYPDQPGIPVPAIPAASEAPSLEDGIFTAEASGKGAGLGTGAPARRDGVPTTARATGSETPAATAPRPLVLRVTALTSGHFLTGIATWYRWRIGQAAAGPRLRAALGRYWRGKYVTVTSGTHHVRVRLTDWCGCSWGRVIDLDSRSFARLTRLSAGIVSVRISW